MMLLAGIAIAYLVLEHGCRERPTSKQLTWFELVAAEQLRVSKKARTRGDVDHRGRTRRQRALAR